MHVHGLRRSFRQWSTNILRADYNKATEICLDHVTGEKGTEEATYDDPVMLEVRREIADRWAAFLLSQPMAMAA